MHMFQLPNDVLLPQVDKGGQEWGHDLAKWPKRQHS